MTFGEQLLKTVKMKTRHQMKWECKFFEITSLLCPLDLKSSFCDANVLFLIYHRIIPEYTRKKNIPEIKFQ